MEEKLNLILSKLGSLETDMQGMKADMQGMKADMTDMKADMQGMKDDIKRLDARAAKIELTLENEIRVNIQRIAEGHLDLSRILHDAMKPNAEVEMLAIKVRKLESEVRDIKFRLA
jgi:outer membrane murein-binding lipoprotein Lpp